jgi:glutamate dehydrogenase
VALDEFERCTTADHWESMATGAASDEPAAKLRNLVVNTVLAQLDSTPSVAEVVSRWQDRHRSMLSRLRRLVAETRTGGVIDLARSCTINAELGRISATDIDHRGQPVAT